MSEGEVWIAALMYYGALAFVSVAAVHHFGTIEGLGIGAAAFAFSRNKAWR